MLDVDNEVALLKKALRTAHSDARSARAAKDKIRRVRALYDANVDYYGQTDPFFASLLEILGVP